MIPRRATSEPREPARRLPALLLAMAAAAPSVAYAQSPAAAPAPAAPAAAPAAPPPAPGATPPPAAPATPPVVPATSSAQALYDQAVAEMDAKRYATACPRLEEVTRIEPQALGAKLTLAECYEAQGRLATAWSQYTLVGQLARNAGQTDRAQRAATRAEALRPRLATLVVEVPPAVRATPGLVVKRDGAAVEAASFGTPVPVDAGGHDVEASAPGHAPWRRHVDVAADGASAAVVVDALVPLVAARPAAPPVPARETVAERPWWRPTAIAVMAAGAAGVGAGAVLGGLALARNGASKDMGHCDAANRCDATGLGLRNAARALGNGSTVAFAVGGVVLAGGVVLFATAPATKRDEPRAALVLLPGGAAVRGSW